MELKSGYTFEWVDNKVVGIGVEERGGVVAIPPLEGRVRGNNWPQKKGKSSTYKLMYVFHYRVPFPRSKMAKRMLPGE
jgi:hypothetical protein